MVRAVWNKGDPMAADGVKKGICLQVLVSVDNYIDTHTHTHIAGMTRADKRRILKNYAICIIDASSTHPPILTNGSNVPDSSSQSHQLRQGGFFVR